RGENSLPETISARPATSYRFSKKQTMAMVFCCSVFGAAAQMLIKTGASRLAGASALAMLTNLPLVAGYGLYGIGTILLILALRDGELSVLYPVISLTFVWVTLLSSYLFHEAITATKLIGITIIVCGVAISGTGGKK